MRILRNLFFIMALIQLNQVTLDSATSSNGISAVTNTQQPNEEPPFFKKWNDYLKEYVRTNIPEIKPNKAIRDYLLRLEFWAPWTLKEEYAQKCEYREQFYRSEYLHGNTQPDAIKKDEYMWWSYQILNFAINQFYYCLQQDCERKGLEDETATLIAYKQINKFFVLKAQHDHIQKVTKEERDRDPDYKWTATIKALKYIEKMEPLPCPYSFETANE